MEKNLFTLLLVAAVSIMGAARCWPNNDDDEKKKQEQMTLAALLVASSAQRCQSNGVTYAFSDTLSSGGSVTGTGEPFSFSGMSIDYLYVPIRGTAGKTVTVTATTGSPVIAGCYAWDGSSSTCSAAITGSRCSGFSYTFMGSTGTFSTTTNVILWIGASGSTPGTSITVTEN